MSTPGTVPAASKRKRAPRRYKLWTDRCIEALRTLLAQNSITGMATFRYPVKRDLEYLAKDFASLTECLRNAARRRQIEGSLILVIENGSSGSSGYHFHAGFTHPPGKPFLDTVRKAWLRRTKQKDNSRKVFHYTGEADSIEKLTAYLRKDKKGEFFVKLPAAKYQPGLCFKPFRHLHFAEFIFPPYSPTSLPLDRWTAEAQSPASEAPESSTSKESSPPAPLLEEPPNDRPEALPHGYFPPGNDHPVTPPGSRQITLRTAPTYGPRDEPIPTPHPYARAHFHQLAQRWQMTAPVRESWGELEATFLIPYGEVRPFELDAIPRTGGFHIHRE